MNAELVRWKRERQAQRISVGVASRGELLGSWGGFGLSGGILLLGFRNRGASRRRRLGRLPGFGLGFRVALRRGLVVRAGRRATKFGKGASKNEMLQGRRFGPDNFELFHWRRKLDDDRFSETGHLESRNLPCAGVRGEGEIELAVDLAVESKRISTGGKLSVRAEKQGFLWNCAIPSAIVADRRVVID